MPRAVPWLVAAALAIVPLGVLVARAGPERAGRAEPTIARATPTAVPPRAKEATIEPTAVVPPVAAPKPTATTANVRAAQATPTVRPTPRPATATPKNTLT